MATSKKDTMFGLISFVDEQAQTTHEYKGFKRAIESNGFQIIKAGTDTVKIYTAELAFIFASKELPARNMDTKTETNINGWDYLKTYIEAYKEGEQYFENEIKVSPNTLYGVNAEQYVRDIHFNFFHANHDGGDEGWNYVKRSIPLLLTHQSIKKHGYYSGIVSKVEEQVKKHPRLFAAFDKCDHDTPPPQGQPKTFEELFCVPEHAEICLGILRELEPPVIDAANNYIGKGKKGIFPLWIKVLKSHKPSPLIKHFKDSVYKDLLNDKVKGLSLTKDASEFRKHYKRLETSNVRLDITALLSQYSQDGKLGK